MSIEGPKPDTTTETDDQAPNPEAASLNNTNAALEAAITNPRRHTIVSIGLNVDGANDLRYASLLPLKLRQQYGHRKNWAKVLALPSDIDELAQVASVKLPKNARDPAATYVKRARKTYLDRLHRSSVHVENIKMTKESADMAKWRFDRQLEKNKADVAEEMNKFRVEVARATASLSSLYDKTRKIWEMQMDGYIEGRDVNGEPINAAAARAVAKDITSHVARIGMPSDAPEDAEAAIFEQYEAAKEATRRAVSAEVDTDETAH